MNGRDGKALEMAMMSIHDSSQDERLTLSEHFDAFGAIDDDLRILPRGHQSRFAGTSAPIVAIVLAAVSLLMGAAAMWRL